MNGQLVDVNTGQIVPRHIEVSEGRISTIANDLMLPRGTRLIDLAGAYVLPGFFDCHVHICVDSRDSGIGEAWSGALPGTIALHAAANARRMLLSGITSARDVGGWDYHEIAVREAIRLGWVEGPRLYCAGRILSITSGSTRYWSGMYEEADGPEAVRKAARKQLAAGADFIKILATGAVTSSVYESARAVQFQEDEIRAAVGVANDSLTYVAAHAHSPAGIQNAVRAGCRSVEHSVFGDEASYRCMSEHGTFLVPTICAMHGLLQDRDMLGKVPGHIRDRYAAVHHTHIANVRLARQLGVRIAMGSDVGTPGNHCGENMQEVELMVDKAGFSTLEAIQAATINSARMLKVDSELGSLEVGKLADVVATRNNPLEDVGALRRIQFVMKEGCIVKDDLGVSDCPAKAGDVRPMQAGQRGGQ